MFVTASTQRQHRRPDRERPLQPGDAAALLIDAHPQGQFRCEFLRVPRHLGDLFRRFNITAEENDPAEIELARKSRRSCGIERPANPAIASCPTWRRISFRDIRAIIN